MSVLNTLLRKIEHLFTEGGKGRWYPLYDAFDTFLFGSNLTTKTAPHVRDAIDFKRIMTIVIIALIPCTLMGIWNTGYQANIIIHLQPGAELGGWRSQIMAQVGIDPRSFFSNFIHGALYFLPIYLVTLIVGSFWEGLFNLIRGHEFSEAFLVTSLLFALILPPNIPLWQVAVGISFGVVFVKEAFGGVGRNFMNPALAARAFLFFAYPGQITSDKVWTAVDSVSSATPLSQIASSTGDFSSLAISWQDAFYGMIPGCIGETSALACLIGAAILLLTRIASWRIMLSMTLGALICSSFFWFFLSGDRPIYGIPPYYHLVFGGFAFGLVFMATDPVSAAHTQVGQWLYGLFVGFLVILIRVQNPAYPEGVMFAILLGNVFAPLFDYFVIEANIKRRKLRHV
ncbi:NADH:ubiquinone reductase (Na(+)-transporting) subunit B [Desulfotalea psychrophila]|uniref:Na(+)-translocating NADH-quinone reductase subunit B n=1 Tax=Desulfotalea psychrophila (strain LSv54 / DSM 12343) TaxID=177439 RepID=Q6AM93_DESPS|nr:NADH:ubiquinone reductase (Na(+)-transporting) subunit B [Desulfotalea psychrophila]CAG36532.1 probable Na+-translocating NADH:quinone oxidoreductase, subunit B [Desulfotalea psychrophila LSv54]